MRKCVLQSLFVLLGLLFTSTFGSAQTVAPDTSCNSLNAIVEDRVKTIANILGVCRELKTVVMHPPVNNALASSQLNSQLAGNESAATAGQASNVVMQLEEQRQQFEARQRINEAATQAILNANAVLLQVQSALLQYQAAILTDEQRAYNRTKLLNAFLGTTVGAIGTGMQFSGSTRVQHAGDGVGVTGGVITAAFALCTAELAPVSPAGTRLLQSFANGNQQHVIPEAVWKYVESDPAFMSSMAAFEKTPPPTKKALSCHFRATSSSKQVIESQSALNELNGKLSTMNYDVADLLKTLPQN
jgi:hypothetical protein